MLKFNTRDIGMSRHHENDDSNIPTLLLIPPFAKGAFVTHPTSSLTKTLCFFFFLEDVIEVDVARLI